jgi:pimeloyl-ACP methyl ester carboxylesterase
MLEPVELTIDVTEAAGLGISARCAATVFLPDPGDLPDRPVVCFAFPGGGYSRRYFSFEVPGSGGVGGQAQWHARRGWVLVACDHLGVGDSTVPDPDVLEYETVARANNAVVVAVMARLNAGDLTAGFPAIGDAVKLGIGQSMGGCFTIVLQAHHRPFDAIGLLGFSATHTVVPSPPGTVGSTMPWIARNSDLSAPLVLNAEELAEVPVEVPVEDLAQAAADGSMPAEHPWSWAFHFDDEPRDLVATDMAATAPLPSWRSATIPACSIKMVAPGTVATEAASIKVPVLIAVGERDVVPDPRMEPKAYARATDITVFVCPRMAHMHNFAGTRERFWERIHSWGDGVARLVRLETTEASSTSASARSRSR